MNRVHLLKSDVDLIREISVIARTTRRPGQTLQARFNEVRRECGCA
jgi:hypothetical protein